MIDLKNEFEGFRPSGYASDLINNLNRLSRGIISILEDRHVKYMSIGYGGKGKFVWINYEDIYEPTGNGYVRINSGGHVSGTIEDVSIVSKNIFTDQLEIDYSAIEFALIPVDHITDYVASEPEDHYDDYDYYDDDCDDCDENYGYMGEPAFRDAADYWSYIMG